MVKVSDIVWFKANFGEAIALAVAGTIFDVDMLTAIGCQETGSLWGVMRHRPSLDRARIAALCCGDTLDANKGRSAFPRFKADLIAVHDGQRMFDTARKALLDMADHVPGYDFARTNTRKFAHGYGVFQYDLQFFLTDPSYFLERRYENFDNSLERGLSELKSAAKRIGLGERQPISDLDFCHVAIAYNTGGFKPAKGLRQGHFDGERFYGENIRDFLAMARTVPQAATSSEAPPAGGAVLPPSAEAGATGPAFHVVNPGNIARLRAAPKISQPETANVRAELPDGQVLRAFTGTPVNGFIEGETILGGSLFRGFVAERLLERIAASASGPLEDSGIAALPDIPPAILGNPTGTVTRRTGIAGARPLNEPDMPRRGSGSPAELRAALAQIIAWLAVDRSTHKRYRPRDGLTFCNIYAHDYCALAGVYLPRMWWSQPALLRISAGETVSASLSSTVDEMRANALFGWFRDFATSFDWRRATTLDELQQHANLGGIAMIVTRRKDNGRSGHIVAIVPETSDDTAHRDAAGRVTLPLQSQAGAVNFRYGRGADTWWSDARFAEFAFWMHA